MVMYMVMINIKQRDCLAIHQTPQPIETDIVDYKEQSS